MACQSPGNGWMDAVRRTPGCTISRTGTEKRTAIFSVFAEKSFSESILPESAGIYAAYFLFLAEFLVGISAADGCDSPVPPLSAAD
ncbi:MAG: hypothetical protein IJB52_13525 [Clostridia bacterium]|nr:hypothetical protein [Clostridia bacterium]